MRRTVTLAAAGLAVGVLAALVRRLARLEPVLVAGDSMRPTLLPGQRVAVGPLDRPPRRGDLVVVRRGGLEVVKRVVGLPGERVRLVAGRLEVDGLAVAEPYVGEGGGREAGGPRADAGDLDVRLGDDQYLVLGDHRAASTDGRDFGPVPADALVARVRFSYWPRPGRVR
jgi:signal peptidase I